MQHDSRNISMLMDFYEMTMAHGYFTKQEEMDRVAFDVFFRRNPDKGGFAIFGGLEQIVEYILNLHFDESDIAYLRDQRIFSDEFLDYLKDFSFTGDVYAFPEGSIIYPNEPVITIVAPLIDAQIVETAVLTMMNHQSLIATKANRIVRRCCCIWCACSLYWWCSLYGNRISRATIWYSCERHYGPQLGYVLRL